MKNGYQKSILAGAIAGGISGVIVFLSTILIFIPLGLEETLIEIEKWTPGLYVALVFSIVTHDVFWGIVLGLLYSKVYGIVPGEGIMKGLTYAMVIYLIANIRTAHIIGSFGQMLWPKVFIWSGIAYFIPYGLVLGYLYKKPSE